MEDNHPTEEEIRARAYRLYWERGCRPGHDIDDWLQAEYELVRVPVRKIAEMGPPPPGNGKTGKGSLADLVHVAVTEDEQALKR